MKFKIYLRVIGAEASIRAFEKEAAWPQARIAQLKRRAAWPHVAGPDVSWQWRTEYVEAIPENIEQLIAQFVPGIRPLAACISKHRPALEWVSLVIVGECAESEIPSGLYFSADTISSIKELGLDLDIDFAHA